MRGFRMIVTVVLGASLCGCSVMRDLWPWPEEEVPVTEPTVAATTRPAEYAEAPAEPTEIAPAGEDPGPITRPAEDPASDSGEPAQPAERPEPRVLGERRLVAASSVQVNDMLVTVEDVLRMMHGQLSEIPPTVSERTFRRQATKIIAEGLQRAVSRALVGAEASRRLGEKQTEQIDAQMKEFRRLMLARHEGSIQALREDLAARGTTLERALADHRRNLEIQHYLRSKFYPVITISRPMLWNYYKRRPEEFGSTKKVRMQIIAAPVKRFLPEGTGRPTEAEYESARAAAKKHIDQARAAIEKGMSFDQAVKKYSRGVKAGTGGLWPLMEAGNFRLEKVEDAAFALEEGEVSDPVVAADGVYLVKAKKVAPAETIPFEEAQKTIDKTLRDEQYDQLTDQYFRKLYERANIVESEAFVRLAVERAVRKYHKG